MKITIKREPFYHVFQTAAAVAPLRSPKTILQNLKLEATPGGTILTATDLEVGVRLKVEDIDVHSPGTALIPVGRLGMILRESADDQLHFDTDSERTLITGSNSRFELPAQNPDEFPEVAHFEERDYFEISPGVLRELIRRTLFATDADSSRYALGGVLLEISDDTITAVGTDGRRLAKMEGPIKKVGDPTAHESATIVPARAMQIVERILPAGEESIKLAPRPNDLVIGYSGGVFVSRLVEGRFPKWREVLPNRPDSIKVDIQVGPMFSALRQAAIVANDDSRGIDFTFKHGSLVLENTTAEVGQSRVEIPLAYEDDELTITLDHRFLADFLRVLPSEKSFTFDVENAEQAAYCRTDDKYGYVIMPLARERR